MNFGYFDLENKEYVITDPATPSPWANYLGDPEYGAMISNNAAGYSFVKSGANGRISRFRFNSTMALPGRYIYIRDNEDGDYWSASSPLTNTRASAATVLHTQLYPQIMQISSLRPLTTYHTARPMKYGAQR